MRLILHIGTEKTGSTAIQQHVAEHRRDLKAAGIALPRFFDSPNHRALASAFIRDELDDDYLRANKLVHAKARGRHREQLLRKLRVEVERNRDDAHSMLITSEHFHSRLTAQEEVQAFVDAVRPLFDHVRVICYLRRQDQLALSFYTQKLRGGFIPPSILPVANVRRLAPALPPFFDLEALLSRWSLALGDDKAIEPLIYDRSELHGEDVVEDFYQRIGCPFPGAGKGTTANESLSNAGQMALLAFNRAQGGDLESRTRARQERDRLCAFLQRRARGAGIRPPLAETREFLEAFRESNARVARRWFGRDALFGADSSRPQDGDEARPDWEEGALLLARYLAGEGRHR